MCPLERGSRSPAAPADKGEAVFAAAKHVTLAAVSVSLLVAISLVGSAGGASTKRDGIPPSQPSNLRVAEATPFSVRVEWDPAQDNIGVAGYYIFRQERNRRLSTSATSYTVSRLACGESTTISVAAYDRAGNSSSWVTATASTAPCLDVQPPSTPSGFRQMATTQDAVVLAWDASTDDVGVVGYGVYRDLARVASPTQSTATLSGLSCGSWHRFDVDAVDAAGNRSSLGGAFVETAACGDGESPTVPSDLSVTSTTQTSVSISWSASSDDVGVAGYHVRAEGLLVSTDVKTSSTISGLACGTTYTITVDAFDAAGNQSPAATTRAATAVCPITPPPPPPGDTAPPTPPGNLAVSGATASSVTLSWSVSLDNVGVSGYGVYRNGASVTAVQQTGATVSGLSCGTAYTFEVDSYDAAGNHSGRASVIGSTASLRRHAPADGARQRRRDLENGDEHRTLLVGLLRQRRGYEYGLYRGGSQAGTTTLTNGIFSGLACNTGYTLAVDAYDAAGNRSQQTVVMVSTTVCPDTTAPTAPTGVVASGISQTGLALTWSASSDNVGVTGYDVYRNDIKVASVTSSPSSQSGLACGTSYSFAVVARDAAGNSSQPAGLSASTTACSTSTITAGETSVLPVGDSGNGNLLVAQQASVGQASVLQSLSFYVTTAAGKLRLGVYDSSGSNGGPGAKIAETTELTPVSGWNTAAVTSPVSLAAGSYWLAYLPSSSTLGFRVGGSGAARYFSYAYGAMPTTFSPSHSSEAVHWSFYATLGASPSWTPASAASAPSTSSATLVLVDAPAGGRGSRLLRPVLERTADGSVVLPDRRLVRERDLAGRHRQGQGRRPEHVCRADRQQQPGACCAATACARCSTRASGRISTARRQRDRRLGAATTRSTCR